MDLPVHSTKMGVNCRTAALCCLVSLSLRSRGSSSLRPSPGASADDLAPRRSPRRSRECFSPVSTPRPAPGASRWAGAPIAEAATTERPVAGFDAMAGAGAQARLAWMVSPRSASSRPSLGGWPWRPRGLPIAEASTRGAVASPDAASPASG